MRAAIAHRDQLAKSSAGSFNDAVFRRRSVLALIAVMASVLVGACATRPTPAVITPPRSTPADLPPPPGAPFFESVLPGSNPAWWTYESRVGQGTEDGTVELCTLGQAMDRNLAYDLAIRNVRNAARVVLGEEPVRVYPLRAAASHALSGEYRVMVQARVETQSAESARVRSATEAAPAAIHPARTPEASPPASAVVPGPAPTSPPTDNSETVLAAPPWYTEAAAKSDGRLSVGASAEGASLRDARRQAVAAARAKLAAMIQAEPSDFQTPRLASQRLPDGRFRVYLLASAASGPAIDLNK